MMMICRNWQEYSLFEIQANVSLSCFGSICDNCTGVKVFILKIMKMHVSYAVYRINDKHKSQFNYVRKDLAEMFSCNFCVLLYNKLKRLIFIIWICVCLNEVKVLMRQYEISL